MQIEIHSDADAVALAAAKLIAKEARDTVAARGKFVMAVSGGKTPWVMLRDLAQQDVPWKGVHVFQVDERVAPEGDPDRNLTHLRESLVEHAPLSPENILSMPVEAPGGRTVEPAVAWDLIETFLAAKPIMHSKEMRHEYDAHSRTSHC